MHKKTYCITAKAEDLPKIVRRKRREGMRCKGKPVQIGGGYVVQPMVEKSCITDGCLANKIRIKTGESERWNKRAF